MNETTVIPVLRTPVDMREWSQKLRADGRSIGCVPTMGALHEGHLSLIRASARECDETIVTIFINPIQFGPNEDLTTYPRDEGSDLELAMGAGATAAYCPSVETMYQSDSSVYVVEEKLSKYLCGLSRPTHFRGVLTVVLKLFNATVPDRAYFGLKDYQQMLLMNRMVRDLDIPVEIIALPVIREPDGLAMSSRNRHLTKEQRKDAICLKNALDAATEAFQNGERTPRELEWIARTIIEQAGSARIDYISCCDAEDLSTLAKIDRPALLALAVYFRDTRLIDNTVLSPEKEGQ